MALDGTQYVPAVLGEPGLLDASGRCGVDHATEQEGVLAVLGRDQRMYRLGAAPARRQRIEQIPWHRMITQVHPAVCFPRSWSMSACMVSRIWPMSRMRSGQ